MATPLAAHASARGLLRAAVEELEGVERVVVDVESGVVCVLCDPGVEPGPVADATRRALAAAGVAAEQLAVEVAHRPGRAERRRIRFVSVERIPMGEAAVRMRVVLEWQRELHAAEVVGERGGPVELRSAGLATLEALDRAVGQPLGLRLVGVKPLRAFDAEIMVASLYRPGSPPARYLGAVLVDADPLRAAALAILNGVNRFVGNYLATHD